VISERMEDGGWRMEDGGWRMDDDAVGATLAVALGGCYFLRDFISEMKTPVMTMSMPANF